MRRVSDLGVIITLKLHRRMDRLWSLCELRDGSFVTAAGKNLKRWDEKGTTLQTFSGHSEDVRKVIELKSDVIVSGSEDFTVKMWRVSTGECLRTLSVCMDHVHGLVRVNDGLFVGGYWTNENVVVWDEMGNCIETHHGECMFAMTRLRDGSIVTADRYFIDIRRP